MGICTLIDAMANMIEDEAIGFRVLANTASSVFVLSNEETFQLLNMMEQLGLFTVIGDTNSTKMIEIDEAEDFLEQARKVYEIAKTLGGT